MILGPHAQAYNLDAVQWEFPLTATGFGPGPGTARLVEFGIDGHDLLPLVPEAKRTLTVHRLDNEIGRDVFRKWDNYRRRSATLRMRNDERSSFSPDEEREFREGSSRVRDIMRRRGEIEPVVLALNVSELPFQVAADGHYRVRATVERGQLGTAWEREIIIVDVEPLATNLIWMPADLHLHSAFASDGRFEPRELAPMLANRGYKIAYITDEPVGWGISTWPLAPRMSGTGDPGTNTWLWSMHLSPKEWLPWVATWESYRDTVRAASTVQVAMFPGAEISASTVNQTHTDHNGHALAYGIQNLIGPSSTSTFDTSGLRYSWFTPDTLLSNIKTNRAGASSAGIAHPLELNSPIIDEHPWQIWSPTLTNRYDGFELMYAGQTDFSPNSTTVTKWRQEIVARLGHAFADNGFPSARTGSDWGGGGSQLWEISYFTFIGLPSRPSDMSQLSQLSVDHALRAGRTVASRLGGLAVLRLKNAQGGWQQIGSRFTMPINSTVNGEVELRAARSGNYRVRIIENSNGNVGVNVSRHDSTRHLTAGQTIIIPVSFLFGGGQRSYHVIVEHSSISANDTIYTSPIFIRQ
jgi:hypothetical protein